MREDRQAIVLRVAVIVTATLVAACTGPTAGTTSDPCADPWPPQTMCGGPPYLEHPPESWCTDATHGESVIVRLDRGGVGLDYCGTCGDDGETWDRCDEAVCLRYGCLSQGG